MSFFGIGLPYALSCQWNWGDGVPHFSVAHFIRRMTTPFVWPLKVGQWTTASGSRTSSWGDVMLGLVCPVELRWWTPKHFVRFFE